MSPKFNVKDTRSSVRSPIVTERVASSQTYEGGAGFARDAKSELFLLAVSNMVGEATFYETASNRDERFERLVRLNTGEDPQWTADFLKWLRTEGNMRSASIAGAAAFVAERIMLDLPGMSRQVVDSVLQRGDEPGEFLACWTSQYGRALPKPVKRGVADAVQRLYSERILLKYDTASHGFRFGDVLDLVHASPAADKPWQGDLFKFALDRRHNRTDALTLSRLHMIVANAAVRGAVDENPSVLLDAGALKAAGMTWEDALSLAGNRVDKARLWEALIPTMGLMALARNLRNFDQAGVSDEVAATVAARFADPEQVAKSRMFPFRWLAAYRHAPSLRWGHALDKALTASLASVPALSGRTLVLVDMSGSMWSPAGGNLSDMQRCDVAAVFGAALAMRAENATLVSFGAGSRIVPVPRGGSLLKLVEAATSQMGGTDTISALRSNYDRHDRVVIVTDEQATGWGYGAPVVDQSQVSNSVPANVPMYTWNLAGYERGHAPSGSGQRHTFGGLSDQSFRTINLLESGRDGRWPWEETRSVS